MHVMFVVCVCVCVYVYKYAWPSMSMEVDFGLGVPDVGGPHSGRGEVRRGAEGGFKVDPRSIK